MTDVSVKQAEASIKTNENKREELRIQRQANVKSRLPLLREAWTAYDDAMDVSEELITKSLQHAHAQGNTDAIGRRVNEIQAAYIEVYEEDKERESTLSSCAAQTRVGR